jgi:hypothetical protein
MLRLAFDAANALEARINAAPSTRDLENVVHFIFPNFIAVLFSFPNSSRENGWGGWLAINQKTLVFPRESPKMQATGVKRQKLNGASRKLVLPTMGAFFTWAAKPSVRKSPYPANYSWASVTSAPARFSSICLASRPA